MQPTKSRWASSEYTELDSTTLQAWLSEAEVRWDSRSTEGVEWHLVVASPHNETRSLNLVQPQGQPDRIDIVAATTVNEVHLTGLRELPSEGRVEFYRQLSGALNSPWITTEYVFSEEEPMPKDPLEEGGVLLRFIVRSELFSDGLTKTLFFDRMRAVDQVRGAGIRVFQVRFGRNLENS